MSGVRLRRLPLRWRLVAGFAAAMVLLLTAAGAVVFWRVEYALDRGLDAELARAAAAIEPLVGTSGAVSTPSAADAAGVAWQVLDDGGEVLDSGGGASSMPLVDGLDASQVGEGTLVGDVGALLPVTAQPYRFHVQALGATPDRLLLVAVRRDDRDEALRELVAQLALTGLGALVVASLVGDQLARRALRPVERFRRRAAEIATGAGGLRLDVPADRDDEVTRLGHTLNDMLGELERSLEHERRFVKDASHELRTPLTLLQGRLQLAKRRRRSTDELETVLDELTVDVARLIGLADALLRSGSTATDQGRAGSGPTTATTATDVVGVVVGEVARRQSADPGRAHDLVVEVPSAPVASALGPVAWERLMTNLLDNAFVHGRVPVHVSLRVVDDRIVLSVADAGDGMSPDLLRGATQRFARAEEARSRPGHGLGLSLVEQIMVSHGGELRLCHDGRHVGHGREVGVPCSHGAEMTVTLLLPRGAAPAPPAASLHRPNGAGR
ncbi:sensor histidine kinase [Nocardioides kribbensis]|uniref:histidine kinase n=1 Tax=Nocardioides kribbensis TaxID=305517 RepID=A0ABV1NYK6_9ACTN